jgi:hypothetical protein
VPAFLDKYARIAVSGGGRTLEDIAPIRSGKLPAWAQPPEARTGMIRRLPENLEQIAVVVGPEPDVRGGLDGGGSIEDELVEAAL